MYDYSRLQALSILKENSIDISAANYKEDANYINVRDEWIYSENYHVMSLEEYIERFLLTREQVINSYDSIYELGNPEELTEDYCNYTELIYDIQVSGIDIGKTIDDSEIEETVKNSIHGKGLIYQLKKHLNFDVEMFDKSCLKNQREICKILYFFYMLKNKEYPKIRVLELLSKHSMENRDDSIFKPKAKNGEIINHILNSISKEIDLEAKSTIRKTLQAIASEWTAFFLHVQMAFEVAGECGVDFDFTKILLNFEFLYDKIKKNEDSVCKAYKFSPIETLYLIVKKGEYLGYLQDIIFTNSLEIQSKTDMPADWIEEMRKISKKFIAISDIESYLEENASEIDKFVYLSIETNKDRRKYRRKTLRNKDTIQKVCKIIDYLRQYKRNLFDGRGKFSELLLISSLQALFLDERGEILKYTFHGYEKYRKHISVKATLKTDAPPFEALEVYWVRKVIEKWNVNIGQTQTRNFLRELEIICDKILCSILEKSNLDDMKKMHDDCIKIAYGEFGLDSEQMLIAYKMDQSVYKLGLPLPSIF